MLTSKAAKLGSLPLLGIGFLQVQAESLPASGNDASFRMVKPKDFPIYDEPSPDEFQLIPDEPSVIQGPVTAVRQQIWKFSDTFQGVKSTTQSAYTTSEKTVKNVVQYIKTEEGFYPRAGVISIAGLAGLVLARRGGFFRKVIYSGGLMTAAASLCYPYQAVKIGKAEIAWVQNKATELYKQNTESKPVVEKVATKESSEVKEESKAESKEVSQTSSTESESKGDIGQSNPEDKDMYTTRS